MVFLLGAVLAIELRQEQVAKGQDSFLGCGLKIAVENESNKMKRRE